VYFSLQADGFRAVQECVADVTFTATAEDFVRLTLRLEDPDTLFFNRRLMIEGNTDLGLRVKNMLDGMDLDEIGRELPFPLRNGFTLLRARVQQQLMAQPAA
jgi:predicted lipid carrier protein YhbT